MCVIVFVPRGEHVKEDVLKNCYDKNPDGWGVMWHDSEGVHYQKDTSSFEEFLKVWETVKNNDSHRIIHFRIATHGAVNRRNCHPFSFDTRDGEHLLMHNGVMHNVPILNSNMSDTWHYTQLLEAVYHEYTMPFEDKTVTDNVAKSVGSSKLIILAPSGCVYYYGSWTTYEGCLFSNMFWKPSQTLSTSKHNKADWADTKNCPKFKDPIASNCNACTGMPCLYTKSKATAPPEDDTCCIDTTDIPTFEDICARIETLFSNQEWDESILLISEHCITVKDLVALFPDKETWMPELLQAALDISIS